MKGTSRTGRRMDMHSLCGSCGGRAFGIFSCTGSKDGECYKSYK